MKDIFLLLSAIYLLSISQVKGQNALRFDGTNDYVTMGNPAALNITGNLTLEAMFKTTTPLGNYRALVSKWTTGGLANNAAYMLGFNNTGMQFLINNNAAVQVAAQGVATLLNDGNWHHAAGTWDGTYAKLYIDGNLVVTSAATPLFGAIQTNTKTVMIGSDNAQLLGSVDRNFPGAIDEVRIWNVARTAAEISNNRCELTGALPSSLVAYYKFNQGTANANNAGVTTLTDATVNALNGTLTNFALNGTTSNWVAGFTGSCPVIAPIPTLSEWGLLIFGLLLLCSGAVAVWNSRYGRAAVRS